MAVNNFTPLNTGSTQGKAADGGKLTKILFGVAIFTALVLIGFIVVIYQKGL